MLSSQGQLYIIATPIGNLRDITLRAIETLKEVDIIACEDTRHSKILLSHYQINTPLISLHEHNEEQKSDSVLTLLQENKNIALISDAGTPLISDPGYKLVCFLKKHNINIITIPGPCAFISALSISGLPTDRFIFNGFLPHKSQEKRTLLNQLHHEQKTLIFYESPKRIINTMNIIQELYPSTHIISLAKELTKHYEFVITDTISHVIEWCTQNNDKIKGEMVLMIAPNKQKKEALPIEALSLLTLLQSEMPLKKAAGLTAKHYNLSKNKLYQYAITIKTSS